MEVPHLAFHCEKKALIPHPVGAASREVGEGEGKKKMVEEVARQMIATEGKEFALDGSEESKRGFVRRDVEQALHALVVWPKVRLQSLHLHSVPVFCIPTPKTLVHLTITECKTLKELPSSICELEDLCTLVVKWCALQSLPRDLSKLGKLRTLDCTGNAITKLPADMTDMPALQEVRLEHNPLLPSEIPLMVPSGWKVLELSSESDL